MYKHDMLLLNYYKIPSKMNVNHMQMKTKLCCH